jgi:hypothetical protein
MSKQMETNKITRDIFSLAQALNSSVVLYNENVILKTTERKALIEKDLEQMSEQLVLLKDQINAI